VTAVTYADKHQTPELMATAEQYLNENSLIMLHCPEPECWTLGAQSCSFNGLDLKMKLMKDEDVKVVGGTCGHEWSLTRAMKEKLRKILLGL